MALGDLMASRLVHSSSSPSPSPSPSPAAPPAPLPNHHHHSHVTDGLPVADGPEPRNGLEPPEVERPEPVVCLPQVAVLREQRHEGLDEAAAAASAPSTSGLVSKWRPKDRMKTGCVALVLCLNISVDPPDVIKISPCARMECWIDPFSMAPPKALENIGKTLHSQYERWQPKARYKLQLDPTVEEVKKLCNTCRKYAKSERVLFHYNGHGVPKPTANGEIWVFNKSYTQYIPLPITDLDSWLKTPSIYVFDCSAAGIIVKAFLERLDWSSSSSSSSQKDRILLAACEAHQTLPQSVEFPADVFTACLTTPIKMALHWFCKRSLLRGSMDHSLIDQIPGRQNDRKTLLGELNWIFTAITDTIAWNVLPHDLFQRLFRQDLLVASLFRNFLLAERIMRSANCSPISYPLLPPTHQHHMWDACSSRDSRASARAELLREPARASHPTTRNRRSRMASTASSFLAVFLLVAAAAATPARSCAPSDLHALLSVKAALGNPATLSSWSPSSPNCCAWDHLRCDDAGRVNNVFIDGADDVHGQIPSAVGGLSALMSLSLFRLPGLTGTIPPCLTALSNLQFLTISHTNVSGPIPQALARLRSLDSVDLSNNKLCGGIPAAFADLPNLRSLDLRHNQLTGPIPAGLVQGQFRSLVLSYNQLTGPIPRDDAQDEINTVDLSHNKLTGDPSHLFVPGRPIGKVDLSWNYLDFDLSKLVFPPELTYLDLSHNRIRGTVPASLERLSTLQKLDLSYNNLCGPLPRGHGVIKHGCKPYAHNQCRHGTPLAGCQDLS